MAEIRTEELLMNIGPQHPSTHGVLRVVVKVDGEIIRDAEPVVGYLHRGTEKLAEDLQYTQIIPYTDRMDYLASMVNNHAIVNAVERAMDLEIPERAEHLRIIVVELNRIASHLVFLGTYLLDLGAMSPFLYAFANREKITDLFNRISGARLTFNYMRVGGVKWDAPEGWVQDVLDFIAHLRKEMEMFHELVTGNEIFLERVKGVGVYDADTAINYCLSGINLRSTGFNWDLRKNKPYSIYDRFDFNVVTGKNGDCYDRYMCHMEEIVESMKIVEQAAQQIPDGPVMGKVPKILRVPAGEYYSAVEGVRGELGLYIVSEGKDKPYRIKWRRPSFINLQLLPKLLEGQSMSNLIAVLGAVDIVLGEVDA
ncbi:NADH dehydrogenase subunit D [Tumebacillus sp. BK434]|uniref:NADH-quinone oxidoreductase subunit D n=1 Tax=Tumebacillus sp. BK434 TaxID=2512169 RepID=UPI001047FAB7|nr:NADH-quinone oxidoreductase subunit D [Tumebacillus sp. BK434]TCP57745.1 NADH dehydrogenase subunit D [Tumebacillus sp. BK434]